MKILSIFMVIAVMTQAALAEPGQGGDRESRHARHMERLIDDLELSSEQEPAVRQILEEQHTKLRNEMQAVHEQMQPKMQALKAETGQRLSTILNEEQLQTFNEKMDKRGKRWQERKRRWHGGTTEENQ